MERINQKMKQLVCRFRGHLGPDWTHVPLVQRRIHARCKRCNEWQLFLRPGTDAEHKAG